MSKNIEVQEIVIEGVTYVPKGSQMAKEVDGMKVVVIRSRDAGVHCGYLKRKDGNEVELINSRRIWYWDGAATLSQLAMEGVNKPANCKFGMFLPTLIVNGVCETIPCSEQSRKSIMEVPEWKK